MGRVTNFPNGVGAGGVRASGSPNATHSYAHFSFGATFDPTSSAQVLLGYLPAGATPIDVISYGGATGGSNPTIIVGTASNDDGYADEIDANAAGASAVASGKAGDLLGVQATVETAVYGKVGASAAAGGTSNVRVIYVMGDL
jgi:hypothetical protein